MSLSLERLQGILDAIVKIFERNCGFCKGERLHGRYYQKLRDLEQDLVRLLLKSKASSTSSTCLKEIENSAAGSSHSE